MKNIIRKKSILMTVALTVLVTFFACKESFLEIPAAGQLSDAQLASKDGVEGLLVVPTQSLAPATRDNRSN